MSPTTQPAETEQGVALEHVSDNDAQLAAPVWRAVPSLADKTDVDIDALAQRLAAAWSAPDVEDPSEDRLADARLLAEVHEHVGHGGFVAILAAGSGDAARMAAVMDTSALLREGHRTFIESAGYPRRKDASLIADRLDDLVLDGLLDAAVTECRELLTASRVFLDRHRSGNPLMKRRYPRLAQTRTVVGTLLGALAQRHT